VEKDNMRLIHDAKGVSKLILILLLLASFIVGALLSYVWSLGYYGPWEYHLPSKSNVTIENVEFDVGDATSFNVTVLNPSYSPSNVRIEQFLISTVSGILIGADATVPSLPYELSPGNSQTFKVNLNWGSYTGQTVNLIVLISDGSGATFQLKAPSFGNLTIVSVEFYPELTISSFNVTVTSAQSTTPVDITTIKVNGSEVTTVAPPLPYKLEPDTSVTFKLEYNWNDSQGKTVNIELDTVQGYVVRTTATAPSVVLAITSLVFNATDTSHFNVTVHNDAASLAKINITQVTVQVLGVGITITEVSPALPQSLQPGSDVLLTCSWDWGGYQGQSATATVTVQTTQGFVVSGEATIP
jgi:hypothetical protein